MVNKTVEFYLCCREERRGITLYYLKKCQNVMLKHTGNH
jgi:hypothetical protein